MRIACLPSICPETTILSLPLKILYLSCRKHLLVNDFNLVIFKEECSLFFLHFCQEIPLSEIPCPFPSFFNPLTHVYRYNFMFLLLGLSCFKSRKTSVLSLFPSLFLSLPSFQNYHKYNGDNKIV